MAAPVSPAGRVVPVHRLRPNETVWSPPSVIFFDTESTWGVEGRDEVHRLRLWAGVHVDRRGPRHRDGPVVWGWGSTGADFARWLTGRTVGRETVWCYVHNLNFDVTLTGLPEAMVAAGWEVKQFSVGQGSPFFRFGRGRKTLTVCDSWSWLPESLASLAGRMGAAKRDLPRNDDGTDLWMARCATDVELLARCVLSLMDWWDSERLGRWTISGPATGWNAMRHTASGVRHVVDPDPELVAQDRATVRGGRKDSAVVRSETGGPWVELDLVAAYPTVARDLPLPVKRGWTFDSLPLDSKWIGSRTWQASARCLVDTDRPRYPVKHNRVTWFPVGRFWTTLAGPELAWARDSGHLVQIGPGQTHRLGFALRPWATWVLDPSRGGQVTVPPVGYVAARSWGRSVLGKFAARSHATETLDGPAVPGWSMTDMADLRVGRRGAEVRMAGRAYLVTFDGDTENCYPAVLAWVESEVRVRLGRVLEALEGRWWTADTDGLIVDFRDWRSWWLSGWARLGDRPRDATGMADAVCSALSEVTRPLVLRPKRVFDSLAVLGPQHLKPGQERRFSGIRGESVEVSPGRYVGHDWPGLKWQLGNAAPGTYRRPERVATFSAPTVHRWVVDDGRALPVEMTVTPSGDNVLLPWSETRWADWYPAPTGPQYRGLARVS